MTRRPVRISEAALSWIEAQAEEIARHDGGAADRFRQMIKEAVERIAEFPRSAPPGKIRGTRQLVVDRRYILIVRERNGELEIAAGRSHWQRDALEPPEAMEDLTDEGPDAGTGLTKR